MNFEFKCPQCGNAVAVDESYRGQVVECPHCAKGIVVPRNKTSGQAVQRPESKVVSIQCPHCGTEYEATQQDMHRLVSCEICGKNFVAGTTSRKQSVGVAQPRPTTQTGSQRSAASRPNQMPHSHGEKPHGGNPHVGIGERDVVPAATQERGSLLHKFLWKPLLSFKWIWPCLLVIVFTVKEHNQNHRARGDRRARPSAICPICWYNESEMFVPSFIGTRQLEDVIIQNNIPDQKYLYEYSGYALTIMQVVRSYGGVLVRHKDWRIDQNIFIEMDASNLVDNDDLPPMRVQYVGLFRFNTALGLERTVRKFKVVSKYKFSDSM